MLLLENYSIEPHLYIYYAYTSHFTLNDYIEKGDILMQVHSNKEINHIDNTIFKIGPNKVYNPRIVYEVID